jgi:hypothetical protein
MTAPVKTVRDIPFARGTGHILVVAACSLSLTVPVEAAKRAEPEPAPLTQDHNHPSGAFTFRTPDGWTMRPSRVKPEIVDVSAGELMIRFLYQAGETGGDALHSLCMAEGLAPPMETNPRVEYEYDFVSGMVADRRALDSAFTRTYDNAVHGHKTWRQRNVTITGGGHSLCVITYAPAALWKKNRAVRSTIDSILGSVTFR